MIHNEDLKDAVRKLKNRSNSHQGENELILSEDICTEERKSAGVHICLFDVVGFDAFCSSEKNLYIGISKESCGYGIVLKIAEIWKSAATFKAQTIFLRHISLSPYQ